ncbi:Mycobacterium numidiamassiliense ORFan, partial [Mycobacterium numidiamassiliense]
VPGQVPLAARPEPPERGQLPVPVPELERLPEPVPERGPLPEQVLVLERGPLPAPERLARVPVPEPPPAE